MAARILPVLFSLCFLVRGLSLEQQDRDYENGEDLFTFITRPDIRSPRFNISVNKPHALAPGYWFVAPYVDLKSRLPTSLFSPAQTGPLIYDGNGELIWSGTHLYGANRPIFDFKVVVHNGSQYLSFLAKDDFFDESANKAGAGVLLDASYQQHSNVHHFTGRGVMNMHEFSTIDDGKRALMIHYSPKFTQVFPYDEASSQFVGDEGFAEIDVATGKPHFTWWALDHLSPSESNTIRPLAPGSDDNAWDFLHLNSVQKLPSGDYLTSARYTDTIYLISGEDGSIIWRLGGINSSFELRGFNMSSQHDARWHSENDTTLILTFFNNQAEGDFRMSAKTSSAVEVALDKTTMVAHLLHSYDRPDGGLTKLRGNAQRLPNGNMFVGWSENSYISEFDMEGSLLLEAQMASHRFVTYRAYKFEFMATPSEPIIAKAFAYGANPYTSTTVMYVSWNGATEVAKWRFWSVYPSGERKDIGQVARMGFETSHMVTGALPEVVVEALDKSGNSLGLSDAIEVELPSHWSTSVTDSMRLANQPRIISQASQPGVAGSAEVGDGLESVYSMDKDSDELHSDEEYGLAALGKNTNGTDSIAYDHQSDQIDSYGEHGTAAARYDADRFDGITSGHEEGDQLSDYDDHETSDQLIDHEVYEKIDQLSDYEAYEKSPAQRTAYEPRHEATPTFGSSGIFLASLSLSCLAFLILRRVQRRKSVTHLATPEHRALKMEV